MNVASREALSASMPSVSDWDHWMVVRFICRAPSLSSESMVPAGSKWSALLLA